ncbi:GSCOCG00011682001-RA-CDS [Cotesia congregata]|nr:GSCOCG00011682001-RA-CDS [Cotesia congregata]
MTMPLLTFWREKGIELIGLVPNSTHIMQPLDISFFHPFKETWKKSVPRWKNSKNVSRVKKEDFPLVLKFALDATAQEKNAVISGFKAAGLYPFDPSAVDYDVFDKRKKSKTTVTKENVQDEVTEDKEKHLLTFETNLSKNILKEFNTAWLNQTLPKDLEITSLYKYRLDVSERSGSHEKSKPTVKEVTLVN